MKIREKRERMFGTVILIFCLVLLCKRLTGEVFHIILGIVLSGILVVHICRQLGKLKVKNAAFQLVDRMLFIALAAVFVSGMLLHLLQGRLAVLIIHKLSSVCLIVGIIVHILQHKKKRKV